MSILKEIPKCKYCGAEIGWLKTSSDKNIAVNWEALSRDERLSLKEGLMVPYDPQNKRLRDNLHVSNCPSMQKSNSNSNRSYKILNVDDRKEQIGFNPNYFRIDNPQLIEKYILDGMEGSAYLTKTKYESILRVILHYAKNNFADIAFKEQFTEDGISTYTLKLFILNENDIVELITDIKQLIDEIKEELKG